MAKISLDPDEIFEHFHRELSYTTLLEGEAIYECDGKSEVMTLNNPIVTPAMQSHYLKNTGQSVCVLDCGGHGSGGRG